MISKEQNEFLDDLMSLCSNDTFSLKDIENTEYNYTPISEYVRSLTLEGNSETAASTFTHKICVDIFGKSISTVVNLENSFVDYVVDKDSKVGNPVLIKNIPLFRYDEKHNKLVKNRINYKDDNIKKQVKKYLKDKNYDFLILTNIDEAYLFNRECLFNYEPFEEIKFSEILANYLDNSNLWDILRLIEDKQFKVDLDKEFYISLQEWYDELSIVRYIETPKYSKPELIVLLLNKIIFIKTLEDHSLIDYKHLQDDYEVSKNKWEHKGPAFILEDFFYKIEVFFREYYNSVLFTNNIWHYVKKDEVNIRTFQLCLENVLGIDTQKKTFSKGILYYNYRQINEDVFGKAYETWLVQNRKDEGIYYTPATLTQYMSNKLVDTLFDSRVDRIIEYFNNFDIKNAEIAIQELKNIKIIDTTSGSCSFLIKVLNRIYKKYLKIRTATEWLITTDVSKSPSNILEITECLSKHFLNIPTDIKLISLIILNHIFASDKDIRSIEIAKTNLWKEAVKLKERNYYYRNISNNYNNVLPNLELNFITGDSLLEITHDKQIMIIQEKYKIEIIRLHEIRNMYLDNPIDNKVIEEALEIKRKIRKALNEEIPQFHNPLFFCLEFFYCYFDANGDLLPEDERGFAGVISNPPWEAIKPVKKEFSQKTKYEMNVINFNSWFESKLNTDTKFKNQWVKYQEFYRIYTKFLYSNYEYQGSGDPNYYKFFLEKDIKVLRKSGYLAIIVPSGIQIDFGSMQLRRFVIEDNSLFELSSFENKGYDKDILRTKTKIFPDVHPQFKFSILFAQKTTDGNIESKTIKAKFYMLHPDELYCKEPINYSPELIEKFSPANYSFMEFRTPKDRDLCLKIRSDHKLLSETGILFRREFDMTNHSYLFHKEKNKESLQLFEGKMIHQHTSEYSTPRYWIDEKVGREVLFSKVLYRIKKENNLTKEEMKALIIPDDLLLDYQTYRLVYRAVSSSTNERTLISAIIPKNVFIGHSMNYGVNIRDVVKEGKLTQSTTSYDELLIYSALFNSLVFNFYLRNKISANLTLNFINELPIAEINEDQREVLANIAFSLLWRSSNNKLYEALKDNLSLALDLTTDISELRSNLEVLIARDIYCLDNDDWGYLTSTFTYGRNGTTRDELDQIVEISKEMY